MLAAKYTLLYDAYLAHFKVTKSNDDGFIAKFLHSIGVKITKYLLNDFIVQICFYKPSMFITFQYFTAWPRRGGEEMSRTEFVLLYRYDYSHSRSRADLHLCQYAYKGEWEWQRSSC